MRTLALDIGTRRTGCAYCDDDNGIPLPLDTVKHRSIEEFATAIGTLIQDRKIDRLVIGLPLLPSGQEGRQSGVVRDYVLALQSLKVETHYLDERYTTPRGQAGDGDARSALTILQIYLQRNNS